MTAGLQMIIKLSVKANISDLGTIDRDNSIDFNHQGENSLTTRVIHFEIASLTGSRQCS